jgi:hypothetical protein
MPKKRAGAAARRLEVLYAKIRERPEEMADSLNPQLNTIQLSCRKRLEFSATIALTLSSVRCRHASSCLGNQLSIRVVRATITFTIGPRHLGFPSIIASGRRAEDA